MARQHEKRLEIPEMIFLRLVAGHTLLDKRRNRDVRKKVKIFKPNEEIVRCREKWKENMTRMEDTRSTESALKVRTKTKKGEDRTTKEEMDRSICTKTKQTTYGLAHDSNDDAKERETCFIVVHEGDVVKINKITRFKYPFLYCNPMLSLRIINLNS